MHKLHSKKENVKKNKKCQVSLSEELFDAMHKLWLAEAPK
jgi:hypothetical protein